MPRLGTSLRALLVVALMITGSAGTADAAHRRVPAGFLGVMADGPLLSASLPAATLNREFNQMVRTGIESVRIGVYWSAIQPYAPGTAVPAGRSGQFEDIAGVPSDFRATDRLYEAATARGLRVLPVILQAPPWARKHPALPWSPPASAGAFGAFVGTVVQRYGLGGTFWTTHPRLTAQPTREWQIWNEPAGETPDSPSAFWQDPGTPFQSTYLAMVQDARQEIKAVDPQAQVVLGGLFGKGWLALQSLYASGGRGLFDAAAIDIYTRVPEDVVRALRLMRAAMNQNGDTALPLLVTEVSWPSARGRVPEAADAQFGYDVTLAQQAQRVSLAIELLQLHWRELNLQQVFWYTWASRDASRTYSFDYAGLRQFTAGGRFVAKPAQAAFRRAAIHYEGCAKRLRATGCA